MSQQISELPDVKAGDLVIFLATEPPGLVTEIIKLNRFGVTCDLHLEILWPGPDGVMQTVVSSNDVRRGYVSFISR